ncbi:MAG: hypothetical protein Fur0032_11270 [Terrimicrobiaceae bacterium]
MQVDFPLEHEGFDSLIRNTFHLHNYVLTVEAVRREDDLPADRWIPWNNEEPGPRSRGT